MHFSHTFLLQNRGQVFANQEKSMQNENINISIILLFGKIVFSVLLYHSPEASSILGRE